MPEDGKRYEAIDGVLYATAAPTPRHQWISVNLASELAGILAKPGHGQVFHHPIGVEFPDEDAGVQPDIIFVSASRSDIVVTEGIRGAPDLVVEIASPDTAERDRTVKRDLYARNGVAQYWIVDPEAECIEVWDFAGGATESQRCSDRLNVKTGERRTGVIVVPDIFPPEL